MSKEKEIVRLYQQGISQRAICKALHTSDRKIRKILNKVKELSLTYEDILLMKDEEFQEVITQRKEVNFTQRRPDCKHIHKELKRKGVTLMILWEEYVEECILLEACYLKYTQFCNVYKQYVEKNKLTMHIVRKPGETCEVDWSETTISIYDISLQNIVSKAYLFVGVLPYSQYMFAKASLDMKEESWICHHVDMYTYFGGVPLMTVCDNCKTAIISHKKYEELIYNKSYLEMGEYYATALMAVRVRKPKDKPSTEGSVGYLTTQIIARLREYRFTSVNELNTQTRIALGKLNQKNFQKREYSREYVYKQEEKAYLQKLLEAPYEYAVWKEATVGYHYHIAFERNYYSVPYHFVKEVVQLRITRGTIEIYSKNIRVATHPKILSGIGKYITTKEHMPDNHRMYGEWNSTRIKNWAKTIGPATYQVIGNIFDNARIEQQVYNQCITILKLKDTYSKRLLEAASQTILEKHITPIHRNFKTAIVNMQEENHIEMETNKYALVRGAGYYGGNTDEESKL